MENLINQKVRVYKNLNKKCLSIQAKESGRWKVVKYVQEVLLEDATFKIYESGRQRCLKEKRKTVHAYVVGVLLSVDTSYSLPIRVHYNPYLNDSFITSYNQKVESANVVAISSQKGISML
jgi:hypothetical protein